MVEKRLGLSSNDDQFVGGVVGDAEEISAGGERKLIIDS